MTKKSRINKFKHCLYVKGVGTAGNKLIDRVTGLPTTLGVFGISVTRYDKKEAHKVALRKSYRRMKRNPRMTPNQLSDAYYKDRMFELNRNGLVRGGFITQYFKKRK
jgi:hypothetical protein